MENVIKSIYKWQVDAGNAERPYDDFLESSFQIEEALEPFIDGTTVFTLDVNNKYTAKELSREVMNNVFSCTQESRPQAKNVDRLDKACDAIVYAIGSMAKLGLDAHGITQALSIVNTANKAKLGCPRDPEGKLLKPEGFEEKYAPEPKLQALLDKYNAN